MDSREIKKMAEKVASEISLDSLLSIGGAGDDIGLDGIKISGHQVRQADEFENPNPIVGGDDDALNNIDQSLDNILVGLVALRDNIDSVETANDAEKRAVKNIKEILETAMEPYFADMLKEMQIFEDSGE